MTKAEWSVHAVLHNNIRSSLQIISYCNEHNIDWLSTSCCFHRPSLQSWSFLCRCSLWTKQARAEASSHGCQLADVNRSVVVTSAGDFVTLLQIQCCHNNAANGKGLPDIRAITISFLNTFSIFTNVIKSAFKNNSSIQQEHSRAQTSAKANLVWIQSVDPDNFQNLTGTPFSMLHLW